MDNKPKGARLSPNRPYSAPPALLALITSRAVDLALYNPVFQLGLYSVTRGLAVAFARCANNACCAKILLLCSKQVQNKQRDLACAVRTSSLACAHLKTLHTKNSPKRSTVHRLQLSVLVFGCGHVGACCGRVKGACASVYVGGIHFGWSTAKTVTDTTTTA